MRINAKSFYTALFVIVLFAQLYVSSFRANIFLQLAVLMFYFFVEKPTITQSFFKNTIPLVYIFLIGFIGMLIHKYDLINIIKDIFHIIKPILGCFIGYLLFRKIDDFKSFIKIIVLCGFVSAIIHFIVLVTIGDVFSGSISAIRSYGRDNFLELFALIFLIFYKKFQREPLFEFSRNHKIIAFILVVSNIFYFSRTMIGVFVILLLSLYGYTIITRKGLKIMGITAVVVAALYIYLFSVKIERTKPGLEAFLYKVKMAPAEIFETKIDRENHKDLWDHWRGYEAKRAFALMQDNPSSFAIGTGYGSLVNLKFFAPLTGNIHDKGMKHISELHNGYAYILYKMGFLGLFFYLFLLLKWYGIVYRHKDFITLLISAIGLIYIFTTLTITGLYNARDVIVFILGALFYFNAKRKITDPAESA